MSSTKYFTEEGLLKLRKELDELKSIQRPLIAKQLSEAREKGDLSENAEYDAALQAQSMLELRIKKMEDIIYDAKIIDQNKLDSSKVSILTTVKLKRLSDNKIIQYTLVPETESNISEGRISISSPISKGLLGKKKGDSVEIIVPAGTLKFEILDITI